VRYVPSQSGAKHKELIERLLTMKDVTTAESVLLLEIQWRDHLSLNDQLFNCGAYSDSVLITVSPSSSRRGPVAFL
jgi:hypothetical protein